MTPPIESSSITNQRWGEKKKGVDVSSQVNLESIFLLKRSYWSIPTLPAYPQLIQWNKAIILSRCKASVLLLTTKI